MASCHDQLTAAFNKQYPEVPTFIVDYLNECLTTESIYHTSEDIHELIFDQIEVYYEDLKSVSITDFSKFLFKILASNKEELEFNLSDKVVKLETSVGINVSQKGAFKDDVLLINNMAL